MSLRCLILLLMLLASSAQADWVWTPERGWHNPQLEPRGTARELYQQGLELFQEQEYVQAADLFKALARQFPGSRYAKRAQFYEGEARFEAGALYEAYEAYEAYLKNYPESGEINTIVEKEYEIGRAFLHGAVKPFLGIDLISLPSPTSGLRILESVVENSPYSDHADDAIYAIAGHHFRKGQYEEAAAQYRRLYTEYPESEWATISQYQAAMCAKRRSQGYEYAAEDLETARRQLEEYGAEHPESMESRSIDTQLASIDEELARKMWDTVRFYERVGKLHSAAYCCRRLEARFPDTSYARLAQAWLAEHPDQGGGDEEEGGEVPPPPADEIMDDAGDR